MPIVVQCECGQKMSAKDEHEGKRVRCPKCGKDSRIPAPRGAAHDVFISYSSKDKSTADALCAVLEAKQIRCWIAPRDILPGAEWGEAIIAGIEQCRVMVLVYSSSANDSPQVRREVERAVGKRLAIVPFRIEDVPLSRTMEYFISSQHWLDAVTPPLEKHLAVLAEKLKHLLSDSKGSPRPQLSAPGAAGTGGNRFDVRRQWPWLAGAAAVLALATWLGVWMLRGTPKGVVKEEPAPTPSAPAVIDLMPLIDLKRDVNGGQWSLRKGGRLQGRPGVGEKPSGAELLLPWEPPMEYRFKLTATRVNKEDGHMYVGLSCGEARFRVVLDFMRNEMPITGLVGADILKTEKAGGRPGRVLPTGLPVSLGFTVQTGKLSIQANGKDIYQWQGNLSSLRRGGPKQHNHPLYILGTSKTIFDFEDIQLEPLGKERGQPLVER